MVKSEGEKMEVVNELSFINVRAIHFPSHHPEGWDVPEGVTPLSPEENVNTGSL